MDSKRAMSRQRGWAAVARKILEATQEGTDLVEYALKIWKDPLESNQRRDAMHHYLTERGLGKAVTNIQIEASVGPSPSLLDALDLSRLSDAELAQLKASMQPALPPAVAKMAGDSINFADKTYNEVVEDAEIVEVSENKDSDD